MLHSPEKTDGETLRRQLLSPIESFSSVEYISLTTISRHLCVIKVVA